MTLSQLITTLCSLSAPSGFEDEAREAIGEYLRPFVDEIRTDPMGNLIALRRCAKPGAKKLVLNAHMDEIGFIVTGHDKGFLRFSTIGGVDPRMLPARRVKLMTQPPLYGVISVMPPHVLSAEDMDKSIPIDKLLIDCGLSEAEAPERIPLGTPIVFAGACEELREGIICGKSIDDRGCAAILLKVFEELSGKELECELYALISTQEELGMRGAAAGVFGIEPDYAIAVDVTHAWTPDAKKEKTVDFKSGAAIALGPNMNRDFTNQLLACAREHGIKHQLEIIAGNSGTDAWPMQVSRAGVATALVSMPLKYMHSPVELISLEDAQSIVELLSAFTAEFGKGENN